MKAALALGVFAALSVSANYLAIRNGAGKIYGAENAPHAQVALVLGAKVNADGTPSDIYRDRIDVAIDLYNKGKVEKIVVSGDHGQKEYDEVDTAKAYILARGVPGDDIFLDHAGFDTYDSVYRLQYIFQAQSAVIVTQDYHLPRALFIARGLGVNAVGASADLHTYGGEEYRELREILADAKARLDVTLQAKPKYLGAVIPLSGSGQASWD